MSCESGRKGRSRVQLQHAPSGGLGQGKCTARMEHCAGGVTFPVCGRTDGSLEVRFRETQTPCPPVKRHRAAIRGFVILSNSMGRLTRALVRCSMPLSRCQPAVTLHTSTTCGGYRATLKIQGTQTPHGAMTGHFKLRTARTGDRSYTWHNRKHGWTCYT
jgi:hypothetical protein